MEEIICPQCEWINLVESDVCENCGKELHQSVEKIKKTVWRVNCPHGNWYYDFPEKPDEKYPFKECPGCDDPRDKKDIAEIEAIPTIIYIEVSSENAVKPILTLINTWSKEWIEINEDEGILGWQGSVHPEFFSRQDGISRRHAGFIRKKDKWYIKHEQGQLGTKLNGILLETGRQYQIKSKDILVMGRVKYEIKIGDCNNAD